MKPPKTHIRLLLTLLLPLLLHAHQEDESNLPPYVGPRICPGHVGVTGYTNTTTLHYDMIHDGEAFSQMFDSLSEEEQTKDHVYVLCPDTTFFLGLNYEEEEDQEEYPLTPLMSNTVIRCGNQGLLSDNCLLKGGLVQVHFFDFLITEFVFFEGLTFIENEGITVFAAGNSFSSAVFKNCVIKNSKGYNGIQIYFDGNIKNRELSTDIQNSNYIKKYKFKSGIDKSVYTRIISADESHRVKNKYAGAKEVTEKSTVLQDKMQGNGVNGEERGLNTYDVGMTIVLFASDIMDNVVEKGMIMNIAGTLEIIDSDISFNEAGFATIGTILKGRLYMHTNTVIEYNYDKRGPVFIDRNSYLYLNRDVSGDENYGSTCDIFMEDTGSQCVAEGKTCQGSCCDFGDESCGVYSQGPTQAPRGGVNIQSSANTRSSLRGDGTMSCGTLCISLSSIILLIVILLGCSVIANRFKKRNRSEPGEMEMEEGTHATVELSPTVDMEPTLNEKAVHA